MSNGSGKANAPRAGGGFARLAAAGIMTRMAWRNVIRNWRHSFATFLAISSSFLAISLFDGFLEELFFQADDGFVRRGMLGDFIIERQGAHDIGSDDAWSYAMDRREQEGLATFLDRDPDVEVWLRSLHLSGMISGKSQALFVAKAYDVERGAAARGWRWEWNTVAGRPLHAASGEPGMLVGQGLGRLMGCRSLQEGGFHRLEGGFVPEDRPFQCEKPLLMLSVSTEHGQVNAMDLPVTGIIDGGLQEIDMRMVHMPLATGQSLLDTDKVSMVTVLLRPEADKNAFRERLLTHLHEARLRLQALAWQEHPYGTLSRGSKQILGIIRNLFMLIVAVISVMSIANTVMKSVVERRKEIGTLRSMGYRPRHLNLMHVMEGVFLTLLACAAGAVGTAVCAAAVNHLGITYRAGILSLPIYLYIHLLPGQWLFTAGALSALVLAAGCFCSWRVCREKVANLLADAH